MKGRVASDLLAAWETGARYQLEKFRSTFQVGLIANFEGRVGGSRQPAAHAFALHEIRVGVLAHDVDGLWSGSRREDGIDLNGELIFSHPTFSLLSGNVRPNLGVSINTQGDTSKLYGGMQRSQLVRLKELEKENQRLRRAVSDLTLDKLILTEAAKGNF